MTNHSIKLENQLCHRFYTISNAFTRSYRPLLDKLSLTYPQYIVMMALWEQDNIPIAQLLDQTHIDGGAMSLMLKKLQSKGYISVIASNEDKRVKHVLLTEEGRNLENGALEVADTMRCQLNSLNLEEAKQLMSLIDKLSDDLNGSVCN